MNISINSKNIAVQGVRALRPGITVEQATQKTKKNGLDELFFKAQGTYYVAYGDSLNIKDLRKNEIPAVMFNGVQADIITYDDEVNSMMEGAGRGALSELNTGIGFVRKSIGNLMTRVGPTVVGTAAVGAAGVGLYRLWQESQKIGAIGASLAASGAAGGALSAAASAGQSAILNGMKIAAIGGLAGIGIMTTYGAVKGALEARTTQKDYASIASITEEGSSPTNQGTAMSWQQLNANAPASSSFNNELNVPVNMPTSSPVIPGEVVSNPVFSNPSLDGPGFGNENPFNMFKSAPSQAVGASPIQLMNPGQLQAAGRR